MTFTTVALVCLTAAVIVGLLAYALTERGL